MHNSRLQRPEKSVRLHLPAAYCRSRPPVKTKCQFLLSSLLSYYSALAASSPLTALAYATAAEALRRINQFLIPPESRQHQNEQRQAAYCGQQHMALRCEEAARRAQPASSSRKAHETTTRICGERRGALRRKTSAHSASIVTAHSAQCARAMSIMLACKCLQHRHIKIGVGVAARLNPPDFKIAPA